MAEETEQQDASFHIIHQYIKDLSFEVPGAPNIFASEAIAEPEVNIEVNTGVDKVGDTEFAVELMVKADVKTQDGEQIYLLELVYGGVAHISGFEEEQIAPLVMIEIPRLLFPFARNVISKATGEGGFVPLLLQPIDFVDLYRQQIEGMMAEAEENSENENKPAND